MTDREIAELFGKITAGLPHEPGGKVFAIDEDEILCRDEQTADAIADPIDALYGEPTVNTGYYDPEEDGLNGETDDRTGSWYVTIA